MSVSKESQKHIVIFDIDSASIGASVVSCIYDKKGQLTNIQSLYETRQFIDVSGAVDFDKFFKKTVKTFQTVAENTHLQSPSDIEGIFCNLSAPWMSSQKRVIHYKQNKPFKITKELVKKCIDKELDISLSKNLDFAEYHDLTLVERRTIDLYLNGFPSLNPYNQEAKTLDIHSLASVMSLETQRSFEHVIERAFHRKPVFFSNTFVNYQTMRSLLPHENNVIILDVSGELTEILVLKNDHLEQIASFPVGFSLIIKNLADTLGQTFHEARSFLDLYIQGKIDANFSHNVKNNLEQAFKIWFREFYTVCDTLSTHGLLPSTLCISTDYQYTSWFMENILVSDELQEHLHVQKQIQIIDISQVFVEFAQKQNYTRYFSDTQLALISYFVTNVY